MNWGRGIILAMVLFVGVIGTMVYVSVNTEFSLVADNYYEQEIAYDQQLARINNYESLAIKPSFDFDRPEQTVSLKFPKELLNEIEEGEVKFFRASGAKHDKVFDLTLDEKGEFQISVKEFLIGAWSIQLQFSSQGKEFYKEIKFVI